MIERTLHDQNTIARLIAADATLKSAVLDAQDHNGTLVALVAPCAPRKAIEQALDEAWPGEVELYCATDLMVGGAHRSRS